jgi:hypothetical protein
VAASWQHLLVKALRRWRDEFPDDGPVDPEGRPMAPSSCACMPLGGRIGVARWDHVALHSLHAQIQDLRAEVGQRLLEADAGLGDRTTVGDHWRGSGERKLSDAEQSIVTRYADEMRRFDDWVGKRLTVMGRWPSLVRAAADREAHFWPPRPFAEHDVGEDEQPTLADSDIQDLQQLGARAVTAALSTRLLDRDEAQRAVFEAYGQLGLPRPRHFFWAISPREAFLIQEAVRDVIVALLLDEDAVPDVTLALALDGYRDALSHDRLGEIELFIQRVAMVDGVDDTVIDRVPPRWFDLVSDEIRDAAESRVGNVWRVFQMAGLAPLNLVTQAVDEAVQEQIDHDNEAAGIRVDSSPPRADDRETEAHVQALAQASGDQTEGGLAARIGWWWAYGGFAVVCERPEVLEFDGASRLHSESGPAVLWRDGWGVHVWHGTWVPESLVSTGWPVEQILSEPNVEIRRCAMERYGWHEFITDAGIRIIGEAEDPGNPGHVLQLSDDLVGVFAEPVRVLLCTNATPERDGTRRRYGLTVPVTCEDPVSAAAWTFGLRPAQYIQLVTAC